MSGKRILVVDDEPNIRRILQVSFDKSGYTTFTAESAEEALRFLESQSFDLMLTDVTMPGLSGHELLARVKASHPELPVVIMTAFGTIPQAVQAMRDGAAEYITKPFDLDHLKKILSNALEKPATRPVTRRGKASSPSQPGFLAVSPAMQEVLELVKQVADSRATVMIGGESGVGKEVVAKALHEFSSRSSKSFVAVSCAAIPETLLEAELFGHEKGAFTGAQGARAGRFEVAHEGTLFLDEIGEIPMATQVKLLRVLQEREFERLGASKPTRVDVRVITATHRDLRSAVDAGQFRLDLLYRLQVVEINIPPLRERIEDIVPLANLFLRKFADENQRAPLEISDATAALLHSHPWPGNVRELENTMERATVLAPQSATELTAALLPPAFRRAA